MSKRIEHKWKDNVEGKICSHCKVWKPLEDFCNAPVKYHYNGKAGQCRLCHAIYNKEWSDAHRKRIQEYNREYYTTHHEKKQAYMKEYRETHRKSTAGGLSE